MHIHLSGGKNIVKFVWYHLSFVDEKICYEADSSAEGDEYAWVSLLSNVDGP